MKACRWDLWKGIGAGLVLLFSAKICGNNITLKWDPNSEPDVVGYHVFYGELGAPPEMLSVNTSEATISNLFGGITYFFYVTAVNSAGLESDPSVSLDYTVPVDLPSGPRLSSPVINGGAIVLRANGTAGGLYLLQTSEDLNQTNWTDLQVLTAGLNGLLELVDPVATPQMFYRLVEL